MIRTSTSRRSLSLTAALLAALLLAGDARAQLGWVRSEVKLSNGTGGIPAGTFTAGDGFGSALVDAGDVDNDGVRDILAGRPGADRPEVLNMFGAAADTGAVLFLRMLGDGEAGSVHPILFDPGLLAEGDRFGSSVAQLDEPALGQVPVVVGAPGDDADANTADSGAAWLFTVQPDFSVPGATRVTNGTQGFGSPLAAGDAFGASVARVGDLDGDTRAEIAVGAPGDDTGGSDAGAVYLLFPSAVVPIDTTVKIAAGSGIDAPIAAGDAVGAAVIGIGDLDGDGVPDLAVGAPGDDAGGADTGAVRILFLSESGAVIGSHRIDALDPAFASFGLAPAPGSAFGSALASADLDGDGNRELLVGAPDHQDGFGFVWMLNLTSSGTVSRIAIVDGGLSFLERASGERYGASIAAPSDIDQDGFGDLVIGHPDDAGGAQGGTAWVTFIGACGDGVLDANEQCDDGNRESGDCCAPDCNFEPDDVSCDDGDACTEGETCLSGVCGGGTAAADGTPCNDFNPCTAGESCVSGSCTAGTPLVDGAPCEDGELCSVGDTCQSGSCASGPGLDCGFLDGPCTFGFCNAEGNCSVEQLFDDTPCLDTNDCTVAETCQAGVCTAGDFAADGSLCDDGDVCTTADACTAGTCGGEPLDCSAFDTECTEGECHPLFGACFAAPLPLDTPCDDGDPCTQDDVCDAGVCAGTPKDCTVVGDSCNGVCNATTGACEALPKPDGVTCSDDDVCTQLDECVGGVCQGAPLDCSFLDGGCVVGFCNGVFNGDTGFCTGVNAPQGTPCDDADPCTEDDSCFEGACAGSPKDCSSAGDDCNVGRCNATTGDCFGEPNAENPPCDDGNPCTVNDTCAAGACAGEPRDCSDFDDDCNDGVCNVATGDCEPSAKPDGLSCSDGNLCTELDECTGGVCDGSPIDCSSLDEGCLVGVCNGDSGGCVQTSAPADTACDDGDPCTFDDRCAGGSCVGQPVDCSGLSNGCNDGACNAVTGACEAVAKPDGTGCTDGDLCTENDACTSGSCGGSPKDCSAFTDQCNDGICNPADGTCLATAVADGRSCSDGAFCTSGDTCVAGACSPGSDDPCTGLPTCESVCDENADDCLAPAGTPCADDGNPCTDDVCDNSGSCGVPNSAPCDDGLFCTSAEFCSGGVCQGGSETCPSTPVCADTCSEEEDQCRTCGHPFRNDRCVVNAVFVLQGSLGLRQCDLCTCDVNSSFTVTTTDALSILRTCAKLPTPLICPGPEPTPGPGGATATTTTTTSSTSTTLPSSGSDAD